jgi:hypothetical protein
MIQLAQARRNSPDDVADHGVFELPHRRMQAPEEKSAVVSDSASRLSAVASLVRLEEGLFALAIGEADGAGSKASAVPVPLIQISAPAASGPQRVEIIATTGQRETWLDWHGGTVIVKSPAGGGYVLMTVYGPPTQVVSAPTIDVQRLGRGAPNGTAAGSADVARRPEELRTEIVLHIERLGDQRFPGQGWVGNRGKRLRIEAFSIRPLETLRASDIEFKALGPNRRQTPWVTDAKLCGTRGQRMPLTGFAIRLAPPVSDQFDVVYDGAFFESGVVGPSRNGELCVPPVTDDPLEAINVRLIRRPAR